MNPSEHLTAEVVADYLARRLAPHQILAVHDHADQCEHCGEALKHATTLDAGGAVDDHLSEQQAVDYVTGKVPAPALSTHLANCGECRAIVDDLRSYQREERRAERPPVIASRKWPWAVAAAVILLAGAGFWLLRSGSPGKTASATDLVASLKDGPGSVSLTASGQIAGIDGLSGATQQLVAAALRNGKWPDAPDDSARLHPDGGFRGTLRSLGSNGDAFAVLAPVGTHEYQDRPLFRWSALPGADVYEVAVFDENLNVVARSGKVHGTDWRSSTPLPRMQYLTWQVAAEGGGKRTTAPAPPETAPVFEIISADGARGIEIARAAPHPSHLLLALLYAQAGMREDAAAEMGKLAEQNPDSQVIEALKQGSATLR